MFVLDLDKSFIPIMWGRFPQKKFIWHINLLSLTESNTPLQEIQVFY